MRRQERKNRMTNPEIKECAAAVHEAAGVLRRYERRFYLRDSLAGASTDELLSLWRDLRRARTRFQAALPPFYQAIRVLNSLN